MTEVRLRQLGYQYAGADLKTLDGIDLTIQHGKPHALLGASGAGKTTLLNLLSGLLHPTEGQILFDGRDVSLLSARERNVALVFQFPVLYESKSLCENLMFPLQTRGWNQREALAKAEQMADELELSDVLHMRPERLPLFQKQLAAIGKSLIREDVDLVLLDEPLTAVEPSTKWRLRQTLTRIQQLHELTMVYVTHDQTEALTFADEVSVLSDGQIIQSGAPSEVYERPLVKSVGHFIGSPGMSFINCEVVDRSLRVGVDHIASTTEADGNYELGVRPEWMSLSREGATRWVVVDAVAEGTDCGDVISLVSIVLDDNHVKVRTRESLQVGDEVAVNFDKYVLFSGESAVAYESE